MNLSAGMRLGAYEVQQLLGAGGMGEVYRARDARLGRDVAIKVLPATFVEDPERRARFEREAKTLAALNHPHIAQVHGLEAIGAGTALVMELVEGEDLAVHLRRGALPLDEVRSVARQLAEGLEAAHEQGIVHRDLKPANIKLRPDGTIKILDFGLAKIALPAAAQHSSLANSPTITSPAMTQQGLILGTAAYMSPEQAKGRPADKRADIWAYGCILYEMLTGRPLFAGETVTETLADVLKKNVDFSRLPSSTPAALRRVIERCLVRDPRARLRDIGDARIDLAAADAGEITLDPRRYRRREWVLAAVAAVSLAVAAWTAWRSNVPSSGVDAGAPIHFSVAQPGVTMTGEFGISRDGSAIVFRGLDGMGARIWVRTLAAPEATPLPASEGGRLPFFSPDGSEVAFFIARDLVAVQIKTGIRRTIAPGIAPVTDAPLVTWADSGWIVVSGSDPPLLRVNARTGNIEPLAEKDELRWASLLPNGTHVLFTTRKENAVAEAIAVAPLQNVNERRVLVDVPSRTEYADGHLLYVRDGTLLAHPFDLTRLALAGDPFPLIDGISYFRPNGRALFTASGGTVAYFTRPPDVEPFIADRTGATLGTLGQPAIYHDVALSPDGTRAIASLTDRRSGTGDVYLFDLARRSSTRVTNNEASEERIQWSRDGRSIAYGSDREGRPPDIYIQDLASGGEPKLLWSKPGIQYPRAWLRDGRVLVSDAADRSVQVVRRDGGAADALQPPLQVSAGGELSLSADERWIAVSTADAPGGRSEVYIQPFGRPGPRQRVSTAGGVGARWRADGSELFYRIVRDVMVSTVSGGDTLSFSPPRVLFSLDRPVAQMDVTPDGQRFILVPASPVDYAPLRVLVNWIPRATGR
jgi:Tol biopolymer transport system component